MKFKDWFVIGAGLALGKATFDAINELTIPALMAAKAYLRSKYEPKKEDFDEEENNESEVEETGD